VKNLLRRGKKIEALKLYRELYGVSLKEAKDVIDRMVV
jgi:ribosomal protein L7/L12